MQTNKNFKNVVAILDNDFGSLRIIKDGSRSYLNDIDLTNSSMNLLKTIESANLKLFLLLRDNLGQEVDEQVKLFLPSFTSAIQFNENLKSILENLINNSTVKPSETIFVSSDRSSRHIASAKGYYALPHVKLASMAIQGKDFEFIRISGDRSSIDQLDTQETLPYYIQETTDGLCELFSVGTKNTVANAIQLRLKVSHLM